MKLEDDPWVGFRRGVTLFTLARIHAHALDARRMMLESAPKAKLLLVVAAALIRERRVLIAQRPEGKRLAGLWEFPGGKLEPNESPEAGLARELAEELQISVDLTAFTPLAFASRSEENFHLLMPLYSAYSWDGEPVGAEGQNLRWVTADELEELVSKSLLPVADVPLVPHVKRLLLE